MSENTRPFSTPTRGRNTFGLLPPENGEASVAVMLATNEYMTGQTVSVNDGWYMN